MREPDIFEIWKDFIPYIERLIHQKKNNEKLDCNIQVDIFDESIYKKSYRLRFYEYNKNSTTTLK